MLLLGQAMGKTVVAPWASRSSAQTKGRSIKWNMLWASTQFMPSTNLHTTLTCSLRGCGKDESATETERWYAHSCSHLVLEGKNCTNCDIWIPPSTTGLGTEVFSLLPYSGMHYIRLNKNAACCTSVINELKLPSKREIRQSRTSTFSSLSTSTTRNKPFYSC